MRRKVLGEDVPRPLFLPMLFLAIGIFSAFQALGYALGGQPQTRQALGSVGTALEPLLEMSSPGLMLFIFINNAVKAGGVILLGVLWGIVPFIFLLTNGLVVGLVTYQVVVQRGLGFALAGLAPHGIVELPALLVAAALGLEMGGEVVRWLRRRRSRVRHRLGRALRIYLKWLVPILAVAAAIEVFVTPLVLERF